MGRPKTNDDAVKERLVACATEMFATRPREVITVRALAAAAGTSTGAVYTLFGGKDGLIAEVRDRAVAGLFQDLSAVPVSGDPLGDLHALAAAYRDWGVGHRHLYTVLFSGAQRFEPSGEVGDRDPVGPLLAAIDRAVAKSVLTGDATLIALSLWVTLHGLVSLELAGALHSATADRAFAATTDATLRGWAPGPAGDFPHTPTAAGRKRASIPPCGR